MDSCPERTIPWDQYPTDIRAKIIAHTNIPWGILNEISPALSAYKPRNSSIVDEYKDLCALIESRPNEWYLRRCMEFPYVEMKIARMLIANDLHPHIVEEIMVHADFVGQDCETLMEITDLILEHDAAKMAEMVFYLPRPKTFLLHGLNLTHKRIIARNRDIIEERCMDYIHTQHVPVIAYIFQHLIPRMSLSQNMHAYNYAKLGQYRALASFADEDLDTCVVEVFMRELNIEGLKYLISRGVVKQDIFYRTNAISREFLELTRDHGIQFNLTCALTAKMYELFTEYGFPQNIAERLTPYSSEPELWMKTENPKQIDILFIILFADYDPALIFKALKARKCNLDVNALYAQCAPYSIHRLILGAYKYYSFEDVETKALQLITRGYIDEAIDFAYGKVRE